ncbi:hypothetical protein [Sulfuriroseicoccus oceanibius]|uniref:Uncharacterized protein n=1 Tax=Sulfuriroseicoccus oceanibius TaxID=2707525 RepID=A0A6B3L8X7_9BACT|nr:hypothetical protein [Sulfuriroseicoccus oceanibius]QQL45900.1 hypothetical protein G3M56_004780 [Sulfuriroseicoccus oceanibius]
MKLEQGQVWKREADFLRIVKWERLAIEYKQLTDLIDGEGTHHRVTKKEFCKLIKGAALYDPARDEAAFVDPDEVADQSEEAADADSAAEQSE